MEAIIGIAGIIIAIGTYLAGVREGRRQERERRDDALGSTMVEEYVQLARPRHDAGPHALARLGLHALGSDALIRPAIQQMHARSGTDPWGGWAPHVADVDLVKFFTWVREQNVDLNRTTVEAIENQVRAVGGRRPDWTGPSRGRGLGKPNGPNWPERALPRPPTP